MVQIIPKPTKEVSLKHTFLFYFSIFLMVGTIIGCFLISYLKKEAEIKEEKLKKELEAIKEEILPLEKKLQLTKKKIDDFSLLINQHQKVSHFFPFFENLIHPQVWFSNFKFDGKRREVIVSGEAESFKVLGQQRLIFKGSPLIKKSTLSKISIGEEGKIHFTFNLSLDPIIFR